MAGLKESEEGVQWVGLIFSCLFDGVWFEMNVSTIGLDAWSGLADARFLVRNAHARMF